MTDESFHLTPLDIRRFDFGSALRGYDRARVDQFRDQVAAEVERLAKQCQTLESKAQGFHEQ
ncbi:MAG: DivIVA domain-containing protein, partial [Gemmatimonadaceae bacterium]